MKKKQIFTAIAVLGFTIVVVNFVVNKTGVYRMPSSPLIMVVGLTLMFLGTIWKAVTEMNEE